MRILFVQKRFHTNQYYFIQKLLKEGHIIKYMTVNHKANGRGLLNPEPVRFSLVSKFIAKFSGGSYEKSLWGSGIPSLRWQYNKIRIFDPDIIIVKRLKPISITTIALGNLLGIKTIVYDQVPAYGRQSRSRRMLRKAYHIWTDEPLVEYTPVEGDRKFESVENRHYVPFVVDFDFTIEEKSYFKNGRINILSIGDLGRKRKGHLGLLEVVQELSSEIDLKLTLLGNIPDEGNSHFEEINEFIWANNMSEYVDLKGPVEYDEMSNVYAEHDVYVLPSYDEPAAISHLEAMAHGLPAICSDTNGTKCYITDGETGYVFSSRDWDDLRSKLRHIISDRAKLVKMGRQSYEKVQDEHSPETIYNYFINELIDN